MQLIILILLAAALYLLQGRYYSTHWNLGLHASITYNKSYAEIGEEVELIEQIENRKNLPLPVLYLKYKTASSFQFKEQDNSSVSDYCYRNDTFSISGQQQITRKLHFTPSKRGYYLIDSFSLLSNDLFIKHSYAENMPNHTELYVYPKRLSGQADLQLARTVTGDIAAAGMYEDPLSFKDIRNYTTGDEMRHINWKATARSQTLMVNTYFDSQSRDVVLILNLDTETRYRKDRIQEKLIQAAATMAFTLIQNGFHVGFASNAPSKKSGRILRVKKGTGASHLHTLLRSMACIDREGELCAISHLFHGKQSALNGTPQQESYLILSNYFRPDLVGLIREKQKNGYSLFLLCIDSREGFRERGGQPIPNAANTYFWEVHCDET